MSSISKQKEISAVSHNIKTYKLVEIPINGIGVSTSPACSIPPHQIYVIGAKYKIVSRVLEKLFECKAYIGVIEKNPNECLDIVVMKQLGDSTYSSWPLSEKDCEFLNIEYEKGLLVFPATYDFKKV